MSELNDEDLVDYEEVSFRAMQHSLERRAARPRFCRTCHDTLLSLPWTKIAGHARLTLSS